VIESMRNAVTARLQVRFLGRPAPVAGQEAVIGTLKINSYPNFLAHRQFTWRLRNSRILRVASVAASSLYSSQ